MMRVLWTFSATAIMAIATISCGTTGPTKTPTTDDPDTTQPDPNADPAAGPTKTRREVDVTRKEVKEVKAPVYLKEIKRPAQDAFREGIEAVAAAKPDYSAAEAKFKNATDQDASFLEAYFNWGMVLERTGRADEALKIYTKALAENPDSTSASAYIAKIYLAKARQAKNLGADVEAKQWLDKAKSLLDQLIAQDATDVAVNNAMALYFLSVDDLDTSERYVKEVLYVEPTNVTGLNTRGLINLKRGKYLIAKWIFENKVLKEDPTSTEALTNLGYTYIKLDQRPLAMKFFTQALEADPENMAVRQNIAAMLLEHLDYGKALAHYDKILAAQPRNPDAKIGRCDAMFGLGGAATDKAAAFTSAIGCYDDFLGDRPDRTDLYKRIADTYWNKLQNLEDAVKYYERYGATAKLSAEDKDKNNKIVMTLKDIISKGGLKAMMGEDTDDGTDGDGTDGDGMDGDGMDGDGATDPATDGDGAPSDDGAAGDGPGADDGTTTPDADPSAE